METVDQVTGRPTGGGHRIAVIALIVLLVGACPSSSETPDGSSDDGPGPDQYGPATQWFAGGTGSEAGLGIAVDSAGNSYVTGHFKGTATFGSTTLDSRGKTDAFVAKLDSTGKWLWAVSASNSGGNGIAVDSAGNSYVSGTFGGTASFGSTTLTSNGGSDLFVAKLDSAGDWLWAVSVGGTSADSGYGISVDNAGNIHVSGEFYNTASFGSTALASKGLGDLFVAKLSSAGQWLWAVSAGGSGSDSGFDISVDSAGNSYVTGRFVGPASFGTTTLPVAHDIFVAKLDSAGKWLWAVSAGSGGPYEGTGGSISLDNDDQVYVTGDFKDTASFGATSLISKGQEDLFVAKLDSTGKWLWAVSTGGVNTEHATGISVDSAGNSYVTGTLVGPVSYTDPVGSDIFVAKLDRTGKWLWTVSTEHPTPGGSFMDYGSDISVDRVGNSYTTGAFSGTATFGSTTMTSRGLCDVFVWKVNSQGR